MKTFHSFGEMGRDLGQTFHQTSKNLNGVRTTGNRAVAAAAVSAVAANLGGRSIRLRNVGRKGARVSVVAVPTGQRMVVKMNGPAQLIERDTSPHEIPKANRRKKSKVLLINGSFVTGPISHPGTQGKHPFEKGINEARPLAPHIYQVATARAIQKALG